MGFVTDNPFNKAITNYLTQIDIDGNKTNVEEELTSVVKAAVYLEESGIIETLSTGADINTLDLTKLNEKQQTKEFTKVEYNKNTSYTDIRSDALNNGFTVE